MKIFVLLIFFAFHLYADNSPGAAEKRAVDCYINGNYPGYFSHVIKLIEKYPESPDSLFYLLTLKIDRSFIPPFDNIRPYYEKTVSNERIDFFTRQVLLSELADFALDKSEHEKAAGLAEECGYIDTWKYTGPFNYSYYNDLNYNFYGIENNILASRTGEISWKDLPYKTGFGWIPLKFLSNDKFGTLYTTTYFYLPDKMTFILWFTSEASSKAFIDSQLLFINDNRDYNFQLNNIYKITLAKGWHNLLVKSFRINDSFNFKCRLVTDRGKPIKGIKFSLAPENIIKQAFVSEKIYPEVYKNYKEKVDSGSKNVLDYYKYSLLDFYFFNENRAVKNLERFITLKTNSSFLNYLAGRIYMDKHSKTKENDYLEKSASHFNRVLESAPNFIEAKRYLVKYQLKKENADKAYGLLKELDNSSPDLWGDYFSLIKWDMMEYRHYGLEILKNPKKYYYSYILSNYFENFDINRALAIYTNQEKRSFPDLKEDSLLDIYLMQNRTNDFQLLLNKLFRYNRYNEDYYLYRASYEKRAERYENASSILNELLKLKPSFPAALELGETAESAGDTVSALKYYKAAYGLNPYDISLYKKISFIEKKKIFYSLEQEYYPVNSDMLIEEAKRDKNTNEDLIKMYLDLMIIKPFSEGGYTYLVRQIFKVLDDKGREQFGEIKIPADNSYVIHVRNYSGKNKVIDAVDYKKHNDTYYISVPDLKIGSVIDVCYQVFYPYNWLDKTIFFYFSPFSFQETDFNMKNSIFVLVEAQDIPPVRFSIRNSSGIEHKTEKRGKEMIHIWKKEDCPKLVKEYNSIPVLDMVPHIYFSSVSNWAVFYNWYYGKIQDRLKIDFDIEQKIFGLMERSKENYEFIALQYLKNCYYFIQENIMPSNDYLYYPDPLELVFSRRAGSTEERTLLMYAFIKKIDMECGLVLARNNQFSSFDTDMVYPENFDSILLHIPKQKGINRDIYLDFSGKHLPFGTLNDKYINARGLSINDRDFKFITTPSLSSSDIIIENYKTIIQTNEFVISARIEYSGFYNLNKEQYMDFSTKESRILEYINSAVNRITILDYSITNLNSPDKNMVIEFEGQLQPEKKVPIIFDKLELSKQYVSKSRRLTPSRIYFPLVKDITHEIYIDRNYKLGLKNSHIKNKFGEYRLDISKNGNTLIIRRQVKIMPQVIDIKNYDDFILFCRQVDDIEKTQLE